MKLWEWRRYMRIKVSDYIAGLVAELGIEHVFTVTGGGAMHLNDSFGHSSELIITMSRLARLGQRVMPELQGSLLFCVLRRDPEARMHSREFSGRT